MPFTSIPTLTDGSVLSAATLNQLSANQEFLYGQSRQANNAFISYRKFTELINVDDVYWTITHRLRYLHYKANSQEAATYLIKYGPHTIVPLTAPTLGVAGYFDLETLTSPALVVGTRYQIIVEIFRAGDSTEMTVDFLIESDNTSI